MLKRYILIPALTAFLGNAAYSINPVDSIGVENNNGKKLIIHKVDPKETYYSISRKYNVNVKDIQTYNNNVGLQIGTIIKVPTDIPFNEKTVTANAKAATNANFFNYTVTAKDNLNLLAERFATTTAEIKKLNGLQGNVLQTGQVLRIPFTTSSPNTKVASTPSQQAPQSTIAGTTEHTVKPKEYLGVIAKQYGVTVEDLKSINGLTSNNLQIGQVLKIPVNTAVQQPAITTPAATVTVPVVPPVRTSEPTFEHVVKANETIYAIAQKYRLTTYQLKTYNNLTSNELTVGQKLIIKGEKPVAVNEDVDTNDISGTLKNPSLRRPAAVYGLNRIEEKGTAVWISDPDLNPNKMLILHRTAPIGTIIQVTNPMTNRSTFAKVVGKFTENETTKDVIVVMTKAVADAVGALDKRFFCNLTYGPKENEQ
jgi:LysM repeat protein